MTPVEVGTLMDEAGDVDVRWDGREGGLEKRFARGHRMSILYGCWGCD